MYDVLWHKCFMYICLTNLAFLPTFTSILKPPIHKKINDIFLMSFPFFTFYFLIKYFKLINIIIYNIHLLYMLEIGLAMVHFENS